MGGRGRRYEVTPGPSAANIRGRGRRTALDLIFDDVHELRGSVRGYEVLNLVQTVIEQASNIGGKLVDFGPEPLGEVVHVLDNVCHHIQIYSGPRPRPLSAHGSLPQPLSQLLNTSTSLTAAEVKLHDLGVASLVLLLQPKHDTSHLGVELHQPVLVPLGEHDDGAHGGEDGSGEDADCDHRVGGNQAPDQSRAKNRASDSGCEITILFMRDILQLNLVNLFCDVFESLDSQFNPVFVGDEACLHELQVTKPSQRLP